MDDLDIIDIFVMDDGENDRNNALRLMLDEIMEPLPELNDLEVMQGPQIKIIMKLLFLNIIIFYLRNILECLVQHSRYIIVHFIKLEINYIK